MKALPLYQQLAEGGDSESMVWLGNIYHDGRGTEKNYAEALKWYRKAADLGEPQAMSSLGYMYTFGEGLATDDKLALQWEKKAADLGDPTGMWGSGFFIRTAVQCRKIRLRRFPCIGRRRRLETRRPNRFSRRWG